MSHTYEQIKQVALDILAGREKVHFEPSQYTYLRHGVAEVLNRREHPEQLSRSIFPTQLQLSNEDSDLFREVFWDLFLDRIIVIGRDTANEEFPWFRVRSSAIDKLKAAG